MPKKIRFLLVCLIIGILIFSTACSSGSNDDSNRDSNEKPTLILTDVGWDSIRIHNAIASTIIEEGYGYPTEVMVASSPIMATALAQGDLDICMEVWVDNILDVYVPAVEKGDIVQLSINFDDNAQGLYVPTYVIEGDPERGIEPMAPNLRSIHDLPDYWELFEDPDNPSKGRIYGAPPGYVADEILKTKIINSNIDDSYTYFSPGSDSALNTSLVAAIEKGEPWVGYSWDPTWIMGTYDMTLLEDVPYTEELWLDDYSSEFPGVEVAVSVNKDLLETAPDVVEFLSNYETNTEITSELLSYMQENDSDIDKAAQWFFEEYEDLWKGWVSEDTALKVTDALESGSSLSDQYEAKFPQFFNIKLGYYVEKSVDWLTHNWRGFFEALTSGVNAIVSGVQKLLVVTPWFVFLAIVFVLGWLTKDWKAGLVYVAMLFIIGLLGLWNEMMYTLAIVLTSVIISITIGIPIGIYAAHSPRLEGIINPLLDGMQTMPSFVYLIPSMIFFGLGTVPAVFATIIYSVPPCIRLTSLAIKEVPEEMTEAAHSFGSSFWQILTKVELPHALPTIMTGVNQTTMMAMSMVVISSMIGAKGLGENVLIAINRSDIALGFNSGISIVFLAIIIDRITQRVSTKNNNGFRP
ncbi:MAG TPA: glycine betaine ABC transporter substrate-binding protein [Clostridia bacterium]|nr:glycine betaine ABC transporter substrate-binding protein [Clostridia bacterium]